jgi:hypothetical protein
LIRVRVTIFTASVLDEGKVVLILVKEVEVDEKVVILEDDLPISWNK